MAGGPSERWRGDGAAEVGVESELQSGESAWLTGKAQEETGRRVHGPGPGRAYDEGGTRFAIMKEGKVTASSVAERWGSREETRQIRRP